MEYNVPSDNDLVEEFLYNKIHNKPLPTHLNILEYDLYGNKNPWEIWKEFEDTPYSYGGKDLYIFTTLKKKSPNSKRYLRIIGLGSWEGEDSPRFISTKDGNHVIGMRKRFCFEKSDTPQDGGWYLHEYSLNTSSVTGEYKFSNHVLCRFRRNGKNDRRNIDMINNSLQTRQKRIECPNIPKPPNNVLLRKDHFKDNVVGTSTKIKAEEEEDCVEIIRNEEFISTAKKRPIVLGLAATTEADNKNVCLGKNIHQGSGKQPKGGDRIDVEETSTRKKARYNKDEEEDDGDADMSWPELFAMQLLAYKDCSIQEEEVQMLPNPFADAYLADFQIEKHSNK